MKSIWDVIVIGGGVVGCAITRKFALMGAKTLLLEKGQDILSGASKANSAILHTGFDAPHNSIELFCMQKGYTEYLNIHEKMNLPILKTGALVVAWTAEQYKKLPQIVQQAHDNKVLDVHIISEEELYNKEPHLSKGAFGAVSIPGEYIIDPWSSPLAYLLQATKHGAEYRFSTEVLSGNFSEDIWHLNTSKGKFRGQIVINCAGLSGDIIESIAHPSPFTIKPRKGQFLVFDKCASEDISSIILPVPTAITKGVLLSKTIFGNLLVGPTAEEQQSRTQTTVNEEILNSLIEQGTKILPSLQNYSVTATYAGLRPATEEKEYCIKEYPEQNWICVGGIRSTGLTASLGIAQYVFNLFDEQFPQKFTPIPTQEIIWPSMPNLSNYHLRDYETPNNGGVICHCELVTHREIELALNSDIPPECLGGLRRRTRVMMGRCNGFFCSSQVSKMIGQRFKNIALKD